MTGVLANSIVFADRPVRAAGHVTTAQLIQQWDEGADNFIKDPPNATVSVLGGDGSKVGDAVVTLMSPKLEGGDLTFKVSVLEGSLAGASGPAALFIDRGGGGGAVFEGAGGFGGGDGFGGGRGAVFAGGGDFDGRDGSSVAGGNDRYSYGRGNVDRNYWQAPVLHGAWYAGAGAEADGAGYQTYHNDRSSMSICGGLPGQIENLNCRMPE